MADAAWAATATHCNTAPSGLSVALVLSRSELLYFLSPWAIFALGFNVGRTPRLPMDYPLVSL